jgi:hypothetical protein
MNNAITTFITIKEYEDLTLPIIGEIVEICMPRY